MTDLNTSPDPQSHHDGIDPVRLEKLQALRAAGRDPFAVERFARTNACAEIAANYDALEGQTVRVAGRVTKVRDMGKAAFIDITDASGRLQLYAKRDDLGEEAYGDIKHRLDIGDFIGVEGFVFKTRTEEVSVHAASVEFLAKALRNLPIGKDYETAEGEERHAGALKDMELRYRQRYVDMVVNKESREVLLDRIKIVRAIRSFLDEQGYLEVETPVLQSVAGAVTIELNQSAFTVTGFANSQRLVSKSE